MDLDCDNILELPSKEWWMLIFDKVCWCWDVLCESRLIWASWQWVLIVECGNWIIHKQRSSPDTRLTDTMILARINNRNIYSQHDNKDDILSVEAITSFNTIFTVLIISAQNLQFLFFKFGLAYNSNFTPAHPIAFL